MSQSRLGWLLPCSLPAQGRQSLHQGAPRSEVLELVVSCLPHDVLNCRLSCSSSF